MKRLDIDALRTLQAVAEQGGVTRAAHVLNLTQPAVSHKLKRLEENLGHTLLNRQAAAPLLTHNGERLLAYAQRILNLHDEAVRSLSIRDLAGQIRLGTTEDITTGGLVKILARFAQLFPDVKVHTHVSQSLTLAAEIDKDETDLAVMQIFRDQVKETDIVLYDDRLHWVKALDFPLDLQNSIPLLTFDKNCFFRHWAMEYARDMGYHFEPIFECSSTAGLLAATVSGMGVSLLNERHLNAGIEVIDENLSNPPDIAYIIRTSSNKISAAVKALAKEIEHETRAF